MTLATQMIADVDDVFLKTDEHAEDVTYTPKATPGSPKSIKAIIERRESVLDNFGTTRKQRRQEATLFINQDATLGIGTPLEEDKVTFDSDDWKVESHSEDDSRGMHRIEVVRYVDIEIGREDVRRS